MEIRIGIVGLGYVGLPIALAFAKVYKHVVGYDISRSKITALNAGRDPTDEGLGPQIKQSRLKVYGDAAALRGCNFFVIAVPTPVDVNHRPDLTPLESACRAVGAIMRNGDTVVFESTVYPGVTEEICGPWLASASGLKQGKDFWLGYSPERINPGDKLHTLENIVKVVSGDTAESAKLVAKVYAKVIKAGVYLAKSIKVAEAAKVIENTQRDLNIALMNELAMIFERMQISTKDVLDAASTKWNFLRFNPGLVGGHCIGVDPYYLTTKAEQLGYHPQVILAGRRINDGMGSYIAQRTVKLMVNQGIQPKGAKVGILGLTFKENVADLRNSRVPDIVRELQEFGVNVLVHDPHAEKQAALEEYSINLADWSKFTGLDAIVMAVNHQWYLGKPIPKLVAGLKKRAVFVDVKSAIKAEKLPPSIAYWSL